MEKLTVIAYAKKMGISHQAVSKSIREGKQRRLKGVVSIDEVSSGVNSRKMYIINYNPDYNNEKNSIER